MNSFGARARARFRVKFYLEPELEPGNMVEVYQELGIFKANFIAVTVFGALVELFYENVKDTSGSNKIRANLS